jgi:hypothetical protein
MFLTFQEYIHLEAFDQKFTLLLATRLGHFLVFPTVFLESSNKVQT